MHGLMTIYKKQQSLLENLNNSSTFLVVNVALAQRNNHIITMITPIHQKAVDTSQPSISLFFQLYPLP